MLNNKALLIIHERARTRIGNYQGYGPKNKLVNVLEWMDIVTVLIVHRIVLFWEPDCCFQDGGQENRREVGTYFITISSVY